MLSEFYESLNKSKQKKVETKVKAMLGEAYNQLPEETLDMIRNRVAEETFQIIKG